MSARVVGAAVAAADGTTKSAASTAAYAGNVVRLDDFRRPKPKPSLVAREMDIPAILALIDRIQARIAARQAAARKAAADSTGRV